MQCRRFARCLGRRQSTIAGSVPQLLKLYRNSMAELRAFGWIDADDVLVEPEDDQRTLFISYFVHVVQPTRRAYAWGIPTSEALDTIKEHAAGGVVEIGAGTGYWARLLAERGVDIIAYDEAPMDQPQPNGFHALGGSAWGNVPPFWPVTQGDASAARWHPGRSLLLVWPPKEGEPSIPDRMASLAPDALRAYRGDTVIFAGYCSAAPHAAQAAGMHPRRDTAGPAFESNLAQHFDLVASLPLPNWPPAADTLTVWSRRRVGACAAVRLTAAANTELIDTERATPSPKRAGANGRGPGLAQLERDSALVEARRQFDWHWLRWRWSARHSRGVLSAEELLVLEGCRDRAPVWLRLAVGFSIWRGLWS